MMISLPLFYNTTYAQMAILLALQLVEALRVWYTWPFVSKKRNWLRFSLEVALALFFLVCLIQVKLLTDIQAGNYDVISIFYGLGWVGFVSCFYFNLTFVAMGTYDLCVGLKVTNRAKMD
jgi:hypothetical protein